VDLGLFEMVTCQYNYLDRKNAEGIRYAAEKGLGVVVMGPVGGGRLAGLPGFLQEADGLVLSSAAGLAIRYVLSNPYVTAALSGMGSRQMVDENLAAAEAGPLKPDELTRLNSLLEKTAGLAQLYCTGCKYCMPCPQGVNIPGRLDAMIYHKVYGMTEHARRRYRDVRAEEAASEGKGICTECGACVEKCPQHIPVLEQLKEADRALGGR
jgi:predicted aldo/keto reductase-like oxidoreductase